MYGKKPMNNVLIDTNLLLYAIDEDSKYFTSVQNLLNDDSLKFYTTSKNISEFLSVVTRLPFKSLSVTDALTITNQFKNILTFLYPTEKSYSIFLDLLRKYSPSGLKIHDYEIVSIALSNKIKNIATVNQKDFIAIKEINLVTVG